MLALLALAGGFSVVEAVGVATALLVLAKTSYEMHEARQRARKGAEEKAKG